ncbi:MAG: SDR family NAD(P)-dependent oxidoreductase [Clostridia bacterium]|nr:SDR family NAD(P)-dependent oxidoreductase [Clostridia bacterium]
MKALVTGASSGIGYDICIELYKRGVEIVAVGRNKQRLKDLQSKIGCEIVSTDLSKRENCLKLYEDVKNVDILINNAGFGDVGFFTETDLEKELLMIDTNITAMHILAKLYLKDMTKNNFGYILNTASIASFLTGPFMATYYSTKAYVLKLTQAIGYEIKKQKKNVYIGALCPGPVATGFDSVAGVTFSLKAISSEKVAHIAVKKMFNKKATIIPTFSIKLGCLAGKILPSRVVCFFTYKSQKKKKS